MSASDARYRPFSLLFLLAVLSLLGGCSTLAPLTEAQEPKVTLEQTRLAGLSLEGVTIEVTLAVDNPNPFGVTLSGFDYAVTINGQKVGGGQQRQPREIAARATTPLTVPVTLRFADLLRLIGGLSERDRIDYRVDATAYLEIPVLGTRAVEGHVEKQFPLPRRPGIAITAIEVGRFDFGGAEALVKLRIDNPNPFGIDVRRFDYALEVEGEPWARARLDRAAHLNPGDAIELELPLEVDFSDIGGALFQALTQLRPLDYRLRGEMALETTLEQMPELQIPFDQIGAIRPLRP